MSGIRREGPQLRINPATDLEFEDLALGLAIDIRATPESLQAELRRTFPRVVVHRRELSGEAVQVWYVYREGHWVSVVTAELDPASEIKPSRRD
jgi:hypothetical protein